MAAKSKVKRLINKAKGGKGGADKLKRGVKAAKNLFSGGGAGGGSRRRKGPTYWANKVLVEKLKKKFMRLKYGGMR